MIDSNTATEPGKERARSLVLMEALFYFLLLLAAFRISPYLVKLLFGCLPLSDRPGRILHTWFILGFVITFLFGILTRTRGKALLKWLAGYAALGILFVVILTPPRGAIDRGAQVKTMGSMRQLGDQFDLLLKQGIELSNVRTADELSFLTKQPLPKLDAWGNPLFVLCDGESYVVVSCGLCGELDTGSLEEYLADAGMHLIGRTRYWEDDIVYRDGQFVKYPEGSRVLRPRP